MINFLAVFIGGGLGSMLRYSISLWLAPYTTGFPWATLCANILSCVVLGYGFFVWSDGVNINPAYKLLVLVGFCGGFSTFSTFSLETFRLIQGGQLTLAIVYVSISVLFCILTLFLVSKIVT